MPLEGSDEQNTSVTDFGRVMTAISAATNKVLANVQNVSAVTAAIAAVKPASPPAPAGAPTGKLVAADVAQLTLNLQNNSGKADAMTQRINTVMQALPKCTPAS